MILILIDDDSYFPHLPLFNSWEQRQEQNYYSASNEEHFFADEQQIAEEHPTAHNNNQNAPTDGLQKILHWNVSQFDEGRGTNLLQKMEQDALHADRVESGNVYFPFYHKKEWQLVEWFGKTSLSQAEINSFLQLDIVGVFLYLSSVIRG